VADVWVETRGGSVREGAITGCTIQAVPSPGGANVRLVGESAAVAHKVGLFSIAGNLISSQAVQIDLRYARGITVTGNTFFSGHERNIVATDSSQLVIGANVFEHNPDYAKDTRDGVRLTRVRGVTLSGNHFRDTQHPDGAVEVCDSRDVLLTGNQVLDPGPYGVRVTDSDGVSLHGCRITASQGQQRLLETVHLGRVTGCDVRDCRLSPGREATIRVVDGAVTGTETNAIG